MSDVSPEALDLARRLPGRQRKKPAACVASGMCFSPHHLQLPALSVPLLFCFDSWWDSKQHEPVLKRAKVSRHSTRGSPPTARKSGGAAGGVV